MSTPPSTDLNQAQQEAVNYLHGPCLVLAGAGAGKTRVITHKIARLIQAGMDAKRIFAITFTNKAASEMRERTRGLIGKAARDVVICTFHALGVRLLREDGTALGLKPNFSILDSDDGVSILKDAGGSVDAATARRQQWTISRWKNQGLHAGTAADQASTDDDRLTARVMAHYEERLAAYQSVDFDDLIGMPLKLLQNHEHVRHKWQALVGHVLVDEYQDTNASQYELLKLLVTGKGSAQARLTAVGDDDQSIYGWRGATLDNLKKLPADFAGLKVIKLEQNYRSTGAILQAANNVISHNPKLFAKKLWSDLGDGIPVRVLDADTEEHEAERTVARIQSLRAEGDGSGRFTDWRDFAVLYRANHLAKPFEKALRKAQIPYKVSGGISFFDRAEVKDLCAWFRLWINNDDDPAFLRAVTTPKRGIGHQTLSTLGDFAGRYKVSMFEALFASSLASVISGAALGTLHEFGREVNDLEYRARHTMGADAARTFLLDWLKNMAYEKYLYDSEDSEQMASARWGHVLDFCDWMAGRCGGQIDDPSGVGTVSEIKSLLEVAQTVSLLSTISERDKDRDVVTLSTLHAAKGLEWSHVMLAGVTEGMLPFQPKADGHAASGPDADDVCEAAKTASETQLQEERRLMYVGITRAKRSLQVSWSRRRRKGRDMAAAQPSRFIAEMALDQKTIREDPRAKLRALREEFAKRAEISAAAAKQALLR